MTLRRLDEIFKRFERRHARVFAYRFVERTVSDDYIDFRTFSGQIDNGLPYETVRNVAPLFCAGERRCAIEVVISHTLPVVRFDRMLDSVTPGEPSSEFFCHTVDYILEKFRCAFVNSFDDFSKFLVLGSAEDRACFCLNDIDFLQNR